MSLKDIHKTLAIGIDPGKHKHAVVTYDGAVTLGCFMKGTYQPFLLKEMIRHPEEVENVVFTIEGQQYYRNKKGSVASDLIDLAFESGKLYECLMTYLNNYLKATTWVTHRVLPRDWIGSVPKDINNKRITRKYGEILTIRDYAKGQMNHLIDAQGLCHWGLEDWGNG